MKSVRLLMALHHHQPVGNFPEVMEACYQKCYGPILEALERHPGIRMTLSYSGPVLLYFLEKQPQALERLRLCLSRNQIELLAGGFYEPVLVSLPPDDAAAQLKKSTDWIAKHLKHQPMGAWLAEAVWEPGLIPLLRKAGLHYTLLRSERFIQAGLPESALGGHYITEHHGETFRIFPHDPTLGKLLPGQPLEEAFNFLRRVSRRTGFQTLTLADMAERWGIWGNSHELVQKSGYFEKWFERLEAAADWLSLQTFSDNLRQETPLGVCYVPGGVNWDLGAWSLPSESRQQFLQARRSLEVRHDANQLLPYFRAGSWNGFKSRFLQSRLMQLRGVQLKSALKKAGLAADEHAHLADLLHQAQCNTAYWHGASGGIYLPHLRQAVWQRLLAVEKNIRQSQSGWKLDEGDFDADGRPEITVGRPSVIWGLSPSYGGACYEWSLLECCQNVATCLPRLPEAGLPAAPQFPTGTAAAPKDWSERFCFLDHFVDRHTTAEEWMSNKYREMGDFVNQPYQVLEKTMGPDGGHVVLERQGGLYGNQRPLPLKVTKTYLWSRRENKLDVNYTLANTGEFELDAMFAVEFNFNLPMNRQGEDHVRADGTSHGWMDVWFQGGVRRLEITSATARCRLHLTPSVPGPVWAYPILTEDSNENLPSRLQQGASFLLGHEIVLAPGKSTCLRLEAGFEVPA
jgi:alpha-amylase